MKRRRAKAQRGKSSPPPQANFEQKDVKARLLLLAGGALISVIATSFVIVATILYFSTPRFTAAPSPLDTIVEKIGPRLEVDAEGDRKRREAAIDARIESYGQPDQQSGTARVPIDRAMAILAAQGWPDAEWQDGDTKENGP